MQTFLPYASFSKSAACLDNRRLGKQRVEAYQILRTLSGVSDGWRNHPAVKMWRGYEAQLADYGFYVCYEWRRRGFKDALLEKFLSVPKQTAGMPPWFGDPTFHAAHRSNLLRKDPLWYGQFGWAEPSDLPYLWPVAKESS